MYTLFIKEIKGFFSNLTGYIVILVFLVANSLFMWVLPGKLNILESGYATIDTLFILAPWFFLFLISALTMKTFAAEKNTGTLELLLTRPFSDIEIVLAKYFASLVLVFFSLLPCLCYYLSVYILANPVGNMDTGGTWGSFIGLFFLAGIYASIGIFSSSLTNNEIIAFIIALLLSFFLFMGLEYVSYLHLFKNIQDILISIGINEHYKSMQRGVIDTRDVVYFISVSIIFIMATKMVLQSRKW